ncbi:MAG TPA: PTS transporter subunit EIIC [Verrucomicrobiae bacterium]|jgi:PTS system cellobiose-specific IIC component|nr:PTS transporter subunit EIIC [Verrucomicrobiae bacterium]
MSISSDASKLSSANSNPLFLWFDRRIVPPLRHFGERPTVAAIRESLPWSFVGMIAALAVLLWIVPVPHASLGRELAARWAASLLPALSVMAVALIAILAVQLAARLKYSIAAFSATCVVAFALALPQPFAPSLAYMKTVGACGLFLAIVVALLSAGVFALSRRAIAHRGAADAIAAVVVVATFAMLFVAHVSLAAILLGVLAPLGTLGDSYPALVAIVAVETLLWIAGIHGPALLAAIVTPLYLTLQSQNSAAYVNHAFPPHIVVVSLFLFVFPGGAGATLPLAVMFACSRVDRLRKIGRIALVPALFNTNEPLLFGVPIVFNPYLALPFVVAPLVTASVTYATIAAGWVSRPINYIPSAVPTLLSTYWATLDPRAVVLVVVNIAIAAAIYWPFVRAYERHLAAA